jgi:hypothetical protein
LRAQELRFEIGVKNCLPLVVGQFAEVSGEKHADIVDEDVEAAELALDLGEESYGSVAAGDIGLDGDRATARRRDLARQVFGFRSRASIIDDDVCAISGKTFDDAAADAPGTAGNECYAAV